jgi:uncharacterized protein (TIGR02145 family)
MKKIIISVILMLSFFITNAQIETVCGTDTIILQVENYKNGVIEWQESIDTLNWVTIPEVSGINFKFFPTQTKYYRAVVKTSTCNPLCSAITLVQLPPIANAGTDRIIGNTFATLLGNELQGATGEWIIISGNGGILENPSNSNSNFTGLNKENYTLKWTLTNTCGQSSDTVVIAFDEIMANNNFIVVDNTDLILSDSTEIANGTYKIKFSDANISPFDSVMLIAMREDISFLRKVNTFSLQDSIYTFITTQGSFQDLFKSGVLNLGDVVNQAIMAETSQLKSANAFPTRETLKENKNNRGLKLLYNIGIGGEINTALKSTSIDSNQEVFTIPLPSATIFLNDSGDVKFSIKDAYIKIAPKFVVDYSYSFPATLTNLRLGTDNGEFEYNFTTELIATAGKKLEKKKTLLEIDKHIIFMAGLVPVDIVAKFAIKASCNLDIKASMKLEETKNYKINLTALVEGDNVSNLRLNYAPSVTSTHEENFLVMGELTSEFKFGPEISFLAYGIVGPYLDLQAKLNMSICANTDRNWDANASIGFEGYLGAKADIIVDKFFFPKIEINLFDFKYPLFNNAFTWTFKMPYKLELLSGNFQSGTSGSTLPYPISLRVLSSSGFGIPLVPVRFELEPGNGSVVEKVFYTDPLGIVNANWTIGSNPINTLKVTVLDCSNKNIENSPIYLYANTTSQPYDCQNSNLTINLITIAGNTYPSVTGGTSPYNYSTNSIDYSSKVPFINASIPGSYMLYVKDKNQCIITKAFVIKPKEACANSNLSLEILVQPNILNITGKNGIPPYQFAVDNSTNFTSTNTYFKLTDSTHTVYIKDSKGCIASKEVLIENQSNSSIKSIFPAKGATSVPFTGITFQWIAGNYVINQVYDLYLKKNNDVYNLIASDLNILSFTYNNSLANSSNYTWKISVKDSAGVELDESEFTFATASSTITTPTLPILLQPVNESTTTDLMVTLKWASQIGDFKYDLYLDTINALKLVSLNLNNSEYVVNNLAKGKTYYWRVKIKSSITGESIISPVWSFTVPQNSSTTITDTDGNVYKTVTIGTQIWMSENLKTTKYNDNTDIPLVEDASAWAGLSTPGYCWYNNDATANKATYGALYNWYTVNTGKLCPTGWHVPTDAEWKTLEMYLGLTQAEADASGWRGTDRGSQLKNSTGWNSGGNGTNTSGFSALPGGGRGTTGAFYDVGGLGKWWSSTEYGTSSAWYRLLIYSNGIISRGLLSTPDGFSVRCLGD